MSRGDRSRQERTSEERERDRIERERRRAARAGGTVPPPPAVSDEQPPLGESPIEETPPAQPASPEEHPEAAFVEHSEPHFEYPEHPPEHTEPQASAPLTPDSPQVDEFFAPELADDPHASGLADGPHAPEPAEPLPEPGEGLDEPPPPGDEPPLEDESSPEHEPPPVVAAGEEHDTRGFPIPGIEPAPLRPAQAGLPAAPPPLRRSGDEPMRRAFRRGAAVTAAGEPRRGGIASRIAALIALLAVVAAIVLLIHSLTRSSHSTKSVAEPAVVKILIPEGKTRVQIAEIAKSAGLKGSYRSAARHSDLLNPAHYGAAHGTPDLEGFLFPATYELDKGAPASRLVQEQLTAFQENFPSEDAKRAHELGVTPYQLLTVASMIEREAEVPGDRAKIAAVIYNRLKAGMPLGIDASIYYAVEQEKGIATYTHELTESQLKIDSPYNTRTHTGLPPTPISNPGTASIQAAAHPAHVAYLYYVAGADGCGEQVFSDSEADFETNVAAYEAAKSKNGGHPPACKHH